jgi:hypothetical protein
MDMMLQCQRMVHLDTRALWLQHNIMDNKILGRRYLKVTISLSNYEPWDCGLPLALLDLWDHWDHSGLLDHWDHMDTVQM